MMNAVPPGKRAELLLHTLHGERHMRRPLLLEALEALAALGNRVAALKAAGGLLERLDEIDDLEFERSVLEVIDLARGPADGGTDTTAAA